MKIHEYQAKQILAKYGVPVPKGSAAFSVDEALKVAEDLNTEVCVVKAQIHAGGRGKGGGVKLANNVQEVKTYANEIIGMNLITHQTSPEGQKVNCILIEEASDIKQELYAGIVLDRSKEQSFCLKTFQRKRNTLIACFICMPFNPKEKASLRA